MGWDYRVKVKHLFTEEEDAESVRKSMNAIADVLDKEPCFRGFSLLKRFRAIPDGDGFIEPLDYANKLLNELYNYADAERIWIG